MNKLVVILVSLVLLVASYFTFGLCGYFLGELEPIIDEYANQYPQFFEWYDYYKMGWNWAPIFILVAVVIWMFVKGNESEYESDYEPPPRII